jgi:hypothetical protein
MQEFYPLGYNTMLPGESQMTFHRHISPLLSGSKMEVIYSFESFVNFERTTLSYIPQELFIVTATRTSKPTSI